ncbi:MAG: hypothetical protein ACI8ZB_003858 [Desulforhopalus sp.]|jgi:hypothetical protein
MKIDKQLKFVLCLLSVLLLATTSWAGQSRLDEIIERGYISVGTTGDYKPFSALPQKTCHERQERWKLY